MLFALSDEVWEERLGPGEGELELSLLSICLVIDVALASEENDGVIIKILRLPKDLYDYLRVVGDLKLLQGLVSVVSQNAPMEHVALFLPDSDLFQGLSQYGE